MKLRRVIFIALGSILGALPCTAQLIAGYTPASPFVASLPTATTWAGQTFTASASGTVGLVSVFAQSIGAAPSSVTFEFRTASLNLPTSITLGNLTVAGAGMNTTTLAAFTADFSALNLSLTAGDSYALLIYGSSFFALGGTNDAYAGGQQVQSFNSGASFVAFPPPRDLYFSVSSAATPVPEPTTYGLGASLVLIGLFIHRSRRSRLSGQS